MSRQEGYRILNPDECEFDGSINDLQACLTETRRQRIQAELKLSEMKTKPPNDEVAYQIQVGFIRICQSWEDKLQEELDLRLPKEQQQLCL